MHKNGALHHRMHRFLNSLVVREMFKPTILIDFDETITESRGLDSPPNEEAVAALVALSQKYKIVIYSCRGNPDIFGTDAVVLLERYLKEYGIPYDEIYTKKPTFFALIDDRTINPKVTPWSEIVADLMQRY